jgi:hypothetical protein
MGRYIRAALTVLLLSSIAQGYPTPVDFDGVLQRWDISRDESELTYFITGDDGYIARLGPYVEYAADMWSDVEGSYVALVQVYEASEAQIIVDMKKDVKQGNFSAGFATTEKKNGKLIKCKIEIGAGFDVSVNNFSKTILHEFGHCLGLGHSLVPSSIMSYRLDKNDFELDLDDRAAVARLYPEDGEVANLPKGCAMGPGHVLNTVWWWFVVPPLFVFTRPKRKAG